MRIHPDESEAAATEAFGDLLTGLVATDPAQDEPETAESRRDRLAATAAALDAAGWLEAGSGVGVDAAPFTLLCALAEVSGAGPRPFDYPLLEHWLALRVLAALGAGTATGRGTALTMAADLLCGNDVGDTSGPVPFAAAAAAVLVPVPTTDGAMRVHLLEPAALPLLPGGTADGSLPTWYLADPAGVDGGLLGELTPDQVRRLTAEYLSLQVCEITGIAATLLDRSVNYLHSRTQFGRPLSAFQALQHRAADLLMLVESVRSLGYYAAWATQVGDEDFEEYALTAKGLAGECGLELANEAIQLHGGIGFTWETGLHWGAMRIAYRAVSGRHCQDALVESGLRAIQRGRVLPGISPVAVASGSAGPR